MKLTDKILTILRAESISPEELQYMIRHSARCRMEGGNRRFHHWLFQVNGEALVDMRRAQMVEVGTGETRVYEEHEDCDGEGCRACGWVGQICRLVSDIEVPSYKRPRFYPLTNA